MFLNGMYYTTSSTCRCQNGRYCMCSCSQVLPVLQLHCSMQVKCPTRILCKLNEKLIPFLQTWMQTNYLSVLVAVYHFHSLWFCTSVIGTQELVITHYQWMWWKMYFTVLKTFFFFRYLSVIGFVINIDTLMLMIPELLQVQRYVLTYRFSQDHLELLFNSIRASGRVNVLLITTQ